MLSSHCCSNERLFMILKHFTVEADIIDSWESLMRQPNYFSSIWRHIKILLTLLQSLSVVRHSIVICANIKRGTWLYILNCTIVNFISLDLPNSLEKWKLLFPFTDEERQAQKHCQPYTENRYHTVGLGFEHLVLNLVSSLLWWLIFIVHLTELRHAWKINTLLFWLHGIVLEMINYIGRPAWIWMASSGSLDLVGTRKKIKRGRKCKEPMSRVTLLSASGLSCSMQLFPCCAIAIW